MNLYAPLRTADEAREPWPDDIRRTGLDYQGRYPEHALDQRPGLHLVDSGDHGAAHVCSAIGSDCDPDDDVAPMTRGELLALACVMLVAWLAFIAGVSVAWWQWFGA